MKQIHQEHFEAWLFSQPDDRTWNYTDPYGCLVATFLKEAGVSRIPAVSCGFWSEIGRNHTFPAFLHAFISKRGEWGTPNGEWGTPKDPFHTIIARDAKAGYLAMFPGMRAPEVKTEKEPIPA